MEATEIFQLIVKADERLKYASASKGDVSDARVGQARAFLEQARDEARSIGNEALVEQAERRLRDLEGRSG